LNRTETKNRYKVCLIVDNPLRDLDGLVLLAWHLANRNTEVFLVPMYFREEVFHIKPDLVLVNYARYANHDFISQCGCYGILVGVLDTEGGVILNWKIYQDNVAKYVEHVDFYCVWGQKQYEALSGNTAFKGITMKATGCPRYDFCVSPWNDAQQKIPFDSNKMVLVNTNFPIAIPRYNTAEKEVRELVANGYEEKYAYDLLSQNRFALGEVVKTVKHLAAVFPGITFVIRPHPFENDVFYKREFADSGNVEIHREGPVFPWIRKSITLLHLNCSTAFDAIMQNVEPVYMDWIKVPLLRQEASFQISYSAGSLQEVEDMLKGLTNGKRLQADESKKRVRESLIKEYFHSADGKCSERVSDVIIEILDERKGKKIATRGGYIRKVILDSLRKRKYRNSTRNILLYLLGSRYYGFLRAAVLVKWKTGKEFNDHDVKNIQKRIALAAGVEDEFQTQFARASNNIFGINACLFSIRISK